MTILAWVVLGLLAGFIGSKIVNKTGEGLLLDIVLGIVGAVVGGWLFNEFGHTGVTGLNLYSLLVAVVGAVIVLVVWHAIRRLLKRTDYLAGPGSRLRRRSPGTLITCTNICIARRLPKLFIDPLRP